MPIHTIAEYQVRPSGVESVQRAIEEFVSYVRVEEPGTWMYTAWQRQQDPTRFVHFFIFENADAHETHSRSAAVKRFEAAYRPELISDSVAFTDYNLVASNVAPQSEWNKRTIREFTRIFKNEHNVDGVAHLFDTQNFVHHFRTQLPTGFEGLRQVGIMMNRVFPDVVVTEEDLIASGDRVVERSSAVATHLGSMMGETPTNKQVRWSEIHIYRLKNGKICEHWAEIAMMELLQQVGVLPEPGISKRA